MIAFRPSPQQKKIADTAKTTAADLDKHYHTFNRSNGSLTYFLKLYKILISENVPFVL